MKVATAAQTRRLEQLAVDQGSSWNGLMARAGAGLAELARGMLRDMAGARVLVLAGPGNNGGDGMVVASHLHDAGANVTVYLWRRQARDDWPDRDVLAREIQTIDSGQDTGTSRLREQLAHADLVIDALLGIGLTRLIEGNLCEIIDSINQSNCRILAVDIPTGIQSDSGVIMGCAIRATLTGATGILKPGHILLPGAAYSGSTHVVELALPTSLENEEMADTMTSADVHALLPARPADSHKGTFGKVMVAAGSGRYPGAAFLTARAALRSGAGLVTLAIGRSIYGALVAASHETTFLPLPEEDWGALGGSAATELLGELGGYTALVLGPGLGREDATRTFVHRLLKLESAKATSGVGFLRPAIPGASERKASGGVGFVRRAAPTDPPKAAEAAKSEDEMPTFVLDADALNILATSDEWSSQLPAGSAILTPHPAEMARLLGIEDSSEVTADRLKVTRQAAQQWKQVVVLKGANTVVADPDGRIAIGPAGNAALATAGTGDVLAGLIGGLVAQGVNAFDAARLGVYLHASAGKLVRDEVGEAGAVAGDLLDRIPRAITALRIAQ